MFKLKHNLKQYLNPGATTGTDYSTNIKGIGIVLKSAVIGILAGTIVSLFRFCLAHAEEAALFAYAFIRTNLMYIPAALAALLVLGYIVGTLVSKNSMISGSGIPQIKGAIMGYFHNRWLSTWLSKFAGGALSILAGLSLGREGPSIQIGGCVAEGVSRLWKGTKTEKKIFMASGASAGLAVAFNAPLAGVMFALEEVYRYFSPRILLSAMTAALIGDFISKQIFGTGPIFQFAITSILPLESYWMLLVFGALLGLGGAFFNKALLFSTRMFNRLPVKPRMLIPFMLACICGLFFPLALGGGHHMIEQLSLDSGIGFLVLAAVVKFGFTMISFGSGAPGGIFFPLLVIGGTLGAAFAYVAINFAGLSATLFYNIVALSMCGYFAAVVRAPITGILLLVEMTGSFSHLLSLSLISIIAYITANLIGVEPVYDALLEQKLRAYDDTDSPDGSEKKPERLIIEIVVPFGCDLAHKTLRELEAPEDVLFVAIRRKGQDIIPRGDTLIEEEDLLLIQTNTRSEKKVRQWLDRVTNC
jgi:H+/Cl- antiporter ClcA